MKVGLIRHFKVKKDMPGKGLLLPNEVYLWFDEYDRAEVEDGEFDLCGITWERCYSSDLPRAVKTAEKMFSGDVIKMQELRELSLELFTKKSIKLPFLVWALTFRIKTLISREFMDHFKRQIATAVDKILLESNGDVLIVSHSFVMIFLRKELMKRGFKGPNFKRPNYGKLYIYNCTGR